MNRFKIALLLIFFLTGCEEPKGPPLDKLFAKVERLVDQQLTIPQLERSLPALGLDCKSGKVLNTIQINCRKSGLTHEGAPARIGIMLLYILHEGEKEYRISLGEVSSDVQFLIKYQLVEQFCILIDRFPATHSMQEGDKLKTYDSMTELGWSVGSP